MKILLITLVMAATLGRFDQPLLAMKHPASAGSLRMFYRTIQALSADSILNETAVAIV